MPQISSFYGIVIKMYFQHREHNPPHFHAVYGEYIGVFDLETLEMIEGDLPVKARSLVKEWAENNKDDLRKIWDTQEFRKLPPLE